MTFLETSMADLAQLSHLPSNHCLKWSNHCPSDGQGSPIRSHDHPCFPNSKYQLILITVLAMLLLFYGEEIFFYTHVFIKSGKTKHKPRRQHVSKKIETAYFLTELKTPPTGAIHKVCLCRFLLCLLSSFIFIICPVRACWPPYGLEFATFQGTEAPGQAFRYKEGTQF